MTELHFHPIQGQARQILSAILQTPEVSSCRQKEAMLIRLACEEVVTNVTSYAYDEGTDGFLDVEIEKMTVSSGHPFDRIVIRFKDGGTPFNPLEQINPDTALSWKQRRIGGLGIFLLRKKMDDVRYAYEDNQNILTIEKAI